MHAHARGGGGALVGCACAVAGRRLGADPLAEHGGIETHQGMAKVSKAADNRGGRVHSLYTAPMLPRSRHVNVETMDKKGLASSPARNFQEPKTGYLPKEENKKGTGYWLLNVSGGPGWGSLFSTW